MRPNTPVTTDSLVDSLWYECPPRTAHAQVLNCVGVLRRAVATQTENVQIINSGSRHTLVIDPDRVDHLVFERLRTAATLTAQRGDLTASIGHFRAALGLWRGRVLDGLELGTLAPAAGRLNELHMDTAERYFDICLEAGHGTHIVADLIRHVGDHPLREHGVSQLMMALHASGRSNEAHETFLRLAARLDRDLGIEPGPEVRRTHNDILDTRPQQFRGPLIARRGTRGEHRMRLGGNPTRMTSTSASTRRTIVRRIRAGGVRGDAAYDRAGDHQVAELTA
jgi:DNA-binding SARP family transcriptional activator